MFICTPRLKKWKKEFMINSNNIKEGIGIQVTFLLEIKLQKEHSKVWQFIQLLTCLFSTLFRMRMCIRMPRLKKKKKVCTINSHNKNQEIGTQVTNILEIKHQMYIFIKQCPFLSKNVHFLNHICVYFEFMLGWECAQVCHDLKTGKEGLENK